MILYPSRFAIIPIAIKMLITHTGKEKYYKKSCASPAGRRKGKARKIFRRRQRPSKNRMKKTFSGQTDGNDGENCQGSILCKQFDIRALI